MPKTDIASKWVSVDPKTGNLCIRFRVKGYSKQFYIASGLSDTPSNRALVYRKRDAIANDIALERFDDSLGSYQFKATRYAQTKQLFVTPQEEKYCYDLLDVWNRYVQYKSIVVEQTTVLSVYDAVKRNIDKLPTRSLYQSTDIRDWVVKNIPPYSARRNVRYFYAACQWGMDSGMLPDNPFEKLLIPHSKKKSNNDDFRAFKKEDRDLIISTFEFHPKYSYYANIVKFLFWTGCRPGEAFALTWSDTSEDCTRITIDESCNMYAIKKGTKNGVKRIFPTSVGSKLHALLLNMKQNDSKDDQLIFTSITGKPLNSRIFNDFWNTNKASSNGREYEYKGVVRVLAEEKKISCYLKPYATRHTFATWAIASGISVEKVANYIGDTPQTVFDHYLHSNIVESECPDF